MLVVGEWVLPHLADPAIPLRLSPEQANDMARESCQSRVRELSANCRQEWQASADNLMTSARPPRDTIRVRSLYRQHMMHRSRTKQTSIVLCCLAFAAGIAISQTKPDPPARGPQHADKQASGISSDRGEKVFTHNCARCHNPPEGFPPSVSGTVALHMRVRANLSEADYKSLLKYLNQ